MRKKIDVYAYYALVGMRNLCGTHTMRSVGMRVIFSRLATPGHELLFDEVWYHTLIIYTQMKPWRVYVDSYQLCTILTTHTIGILPNQKNPLHLV